MAIVRINERTIVQKIKRIVLGVNRPNLMIRVSVIIGFLVWLYFFIWQVLILMSIILVDRLQDPDLITSTFNRLGYKYSFMHRWGLDIMQTLLVHSSVLITLYFISLLGLVFIYRRKKRGHIIYALSNAFSLVFTILFLGVNYFKEQISITDNVIFITITLYFLVGIFFFRKK